MDTRMAMRLIRGEAASNVARELGIGESTVVRQLHAWLRQQPWYSTDEFIGYLSEPRSGVLTSARALFKSRAAPG